MQHMMMAMVNLKNQSSIKTACNRKKEAKEKEKMAQVGAVGTKTSQETQNSQKTKKKHTNSEFLEILRERNEELKEKILNGETEESKANRSRFVYEIRNGVSFEEDFDDTDMIKQQIREEITKRVESRKN